MEKNIKVMNKITELLETCEIGLKHIQHQYQQMRYEESMMLFHDVIHAFATIENSYNNLNVKEEIKSSNELRKAFDLIVNFYEENDYAQLQQVMQFTLLPSFKRWRAELEDNLTQLLMN
ncbi:hypothetical protein [Bacillus solimangrovi]|uniref:DUF8042 domain-containing protein n=1 Tax=Bacillus solimangrovi TaxID=1305675 RepID=A0A1E5LDP2_9BACI|nr:hypothetical protein [Bacillus solimangrovi]OEH92205.1 hypothetical protein BFG57_02740 [Bacillus solimangrovi]